MSFLTFCSKRVSRRIAAAILATAALMPMTVPAANTWGTDYSDLWWNSGESGWGANLAHQQEIIFMTIFAYGPDSRPVWYAVPAMASVGTALTDKFVGTLYATTGPYLGNTVFDPDLVGRREAGTATLSFLRPERGYLTYTVDGVTVTKEIVRQTFRMNNLVGNYIGAAVGTAVGTSAQCAGGLGDFERGTRYAITQSGPTLTIVSTRDTGQSCSYQGQYLQRGRMGELFGSLSCSDGRTGTFAAVEMEASYLGFIARFETTYESGCVETGSFGGMKR